MPEKTQSTRETTYALAVREAMQQAMRRDPKVFLMGEDVGVYGGAFGVSDTMVEEFGTERVRDTPISEAAIAGAAIGAAVSGMRPIAEIQFMDFITLSMETLVLQGAKMRYMFGGKTKVPMVLRTPAGSGTGAAAQHSESLEAWFMNVPGIKVVMPSTPYDVKGLLLASIEDDNIVLFIESKLLYKTKGIVPEDYYTVPLGKSDIKRVGKHLTVVAYGIEAARSLEAAEILSKDGIELEVVDPRTLKPMDMEPIVASVKKTGKALVVHEAPITGGVGGEIVARIVESEAFDYLDAPVRRLAGLDIPIPYNRELEKLAVPQVEDIVREARAMVQLKY